MGEEDEIEVRRIQARIAPNLLAQVIEAFCDRDGADKDAWFTEFSSHYLAPMDRLRDEGWYANLTLIAAEGLVQETRQAMNPNIRPR